MRDRIARHKAVRPTDWFTLEEPLDLARAVQQASQEADVLLLDCMTLWLSNWMGRSNTIESADDVTLKHAYTDGVLAAIETLLATVRTLPADKTLLIVSNEVGLGIVPMHPLSRTYRDVLGWVNQRLARDAERVYLMVAGLAVDIKRLEGEATL